MANIEIDYTDIAGIRNNITKTVPLYLAGSYGTGTSAGTGTYGSLGDGGMATSAQLWLPTAVGPDIFGNVYIADYRNMKIRLVNSAGTITTIAGTGTDGSTGDGGPATSAQLNYPSGVVADLYGNIYIADYQNKKIRMVTSAGSKHTLLNTIYILTNL